MDAPALKVVPVLISAELFPFSLMESGQMQIGIDDLKKILPLGCIPVAVELVDGARPLPEYTHPDRALYIFGPEDGSLDKEIRDWCEDVVYIPTTGCMNLAATVNVVLYDRLAKGNNTRSGPKY